MAKRSFSNLVNKSKDLSQISHNLLHNQIVLYVVFFIAVANLFHFVYSNDLMPVGIFIATGILTSFFSKNMVVIMILSMVVANIYRVGYGKKEGFGKNKEEEDGDEEFETNLDEDDDKEGMKDEDEDEEDDDEKKDKEGMKDDEDDVEGFTTNVTFTNNEKLKLKKLAETLKLEDK
jgi:hypothetical protein